MKAERDRQKIVNSQHQIRMLMTPGHKTLKVVLKRPSPIINCYHICKFKHSGAPQCHAQSNSQSHQSRLFS